VRTVAVPEPIHEDAVAVLEREVEVLAGGALADADGIIVRLTPVSGELLRRAPRLAVIGKHGVGLDNIDVVAATAAGVPVVFAPDTATEAVAEFVVMQMLRLARDPLPAEKELRQGRFREGRQRARGSELHGKAIGVVGLGRIGVRVAEICSGGFCMRVVAYDPYVSPAAVAGRDVELAADLDSLLRTADFVSVHVPLADATRGLIGARELALLKPGAYLVNCARGGVVDEGALFDALRRGALAGAAVDVFADEPPAASHPLLTLDNVLATPHVAGSTAESLRATAVTVAEDVLRVLRGERPLNLANAEVWPV
jgi:D-3-phosphoglycerate dehydrogenase